MKKPDQVAIIGLGKAGLARLKAILKCPELKLIATCSKRGSIQEQIHSLSPYFSQEQIDQIKDIPNLSLSELWALPHLDTVMICSENQLHFAQAQQALTRGLHTIIDFPLCNTKAEAIELYRLAQENQCILQPAFIGQLSYQQRLWKNQCLESPLQSICLKLTGGYYRWIEEDAKQGKLGNLALSRFLTLWSLAGAIQEGYALEAELFTDGYRFSISGTTIQGTQFLLTEERKVGVTRSVSTTGLLQNGTALLQGKANGSTGGMEPLFEWDIQEFIKGFYTQEGSLYQAPAFQSQLLEVISFCEGLDLQFKHLLKIS